MHKHYSLDFKQQVIKKYYSLGNNINDIIENFDISRRTLFYWIKKEKSGKLNNKFNSSKNGNPYKIDKYKLNQLEQNNIEDYSLKELSELLKVSISGIHKYFVKNNITFKKKNYGIKKAIQ